MRKVIKGDEWNIIQEGFDPKDSLLTESIFSLANGYMGGRGNFEEGYGGKTLRSFFQAGVYYPDKALYGWYKIGYPEKNNKVINSTDIIGIKVFIGGKKLDLATSHFEDFKRTLDMKSGLLGRSFTVIDEKGCRTAINVRRFLSMQNPHLLAISYSITPLNYSGYLEIEPYMNGAVLNYDAQDNGKGFWEEVYKDEDTLVVRTKKTNFYLATSMKVRIFENESFKRVSFELAKDDRYVGNRFKMNLHKGKTIKVEKLVSCYNSRRTPKSGVASKSKEDVSSSFKYSFEELLKFSEKIWKKKWEKKDIKIEGDVSSQQAIRFNLFVLNSTYTGSDSSLNISPKGFTGEMYSGSTYWDTEIFCLPYFLYTEPEIARNLLLYRYNSLSKAIENAKMLGLKGALYPMITLDGTEGHAEWEITMMEIHRNSAIAFAIYNYIRATGDQNYMTDYGFEVIGNIARFWADRSTYKKEKDVYMILGVTGPDEFHNNVNNNWYTNIMAKWVLNYAYEQSIWLKNNSKNKYEIICERYDFSEDEFRNWKIISDKMYINKDEKLSIFVQHDGYFDSDQVLVSEVPKGELPVVQNWSWDRINRSCLVKQADVILGLYVLNDYFTIEEKKDNFDFYEPRTVHESSLSACIYSIIASEIGYHDKAFELYYRASRLDLDDYNNDTVNGLHVTSMGGAWMSIVEGFGGFRVTDRSVIFNPYVPKAWESLSFDVTVKKRKFSIFISHDELNIKLKSGNEIDIIVYGERCTVSPDKELSIIV